MCLKVIISSPLVTVIQKNFTQHTITKRQTMGAFTEASKLKHTSESSKLSRWTEWIVGETVKHRSRNSRCWRESDTSTVRANVTDEGEKLFGCFLNENKNSAACFTIEINTRGFQTWDVNVAEAKSDKNTHRCCLSFALVLLNKQSVKIASTTNRSKKKMQ